MVAGTAFIAGTGLDLALEQHWYVPGSGWVHSDDTPWYLLYHYGVIPTYIIGGCAVAVLCASIFTPKLVPLRRGALFLFLALLIGPGLLVNSTFKEHWGRPRPRQVQIFGGERQFHQVWERGEGGKGASFPSGHASAAFYLMIPYFLWRSSAPRRARLVLAGGIGYGLVMGMARMVQGGHFPSDVLWAGGIVYLVGLVLCHLLRVDQELDLRAEEVSL